MDHEHILILGATGLSGSALIHHCLTLSPPSRPYVTLYVRSAERLPSAIKESPATSKFRVVEGELDSDSDFSAALAPSEEFPPVTTTVSVLGASMSIGPVFSRFFFRQPTPIADAFSSNIMPQLKRCGVKRILSLSTPTAMYSESERKSMGWKWWLYSFLPLVLAPQGNAEMKGIAENIIVDAGEDVDWTVFRVPHLTEAPGKGVIVGKLDGSYQGNLNLSREALAYWLIQEIEERNWVRMVVMLGDA